MPAEVPHSRCSGSLLNSATPPPNRAQTASPAASQIRGMVTTDCQPAESEAASPPPAPVVGASTRVSRLHTRYILRPGLGGRLEPAGEEVPGGQQPEPGGQHRVGERHEAEHGGEPSQQQPPVPAQAELVVRHSPA